jgi:hypothetical protein
MAEGRTTRGRFGVKATQTGGIVGRAAEKLKEGKLIRGIVDAPTILTSEILIGGSIIPFRGLKIGGKNGRLRVGHERKCRHGHANWAKKFHDKRQ